LVLRFSGFELDRGRAVLRGADGNAIKIRPKTFEMLGLFAANAGQILTKQTLTEALWPNVHVGEDSLFQCIRELRRALGDERRDVIKLVFRPRLFVRRRDIGRAGASHRRLVEISFRKA
jgi:DNA-binding winged helix-turn-helix (wHTH) protein